MHLNIEETRNNEPQAFHAKTQSQARPQLTPAQKAKITRELNRKAQELEERRILNENLGTRSSKARARDIVIKDAIRSSRGNQRGKPYTGNNKRVVSSDSEEEATPPPPTPPPKKPRTYRTSNSQPAMTSLTATPSPSPNGMHSDSEVLPAEKPRSLRKGAKGPAPNPQIRNQIIQVNADNGGEDSITEDEDAEQEERRDMNDIDQGSDGEGAQSDGMQDLEALASRPDALRAALDKETPRIVQPPSCAGDAEHGSQNISNSTSRSQRKVLSRLRLTEDEDLPMTTQGHDDNHGDLPATPPGEHGDLSETPPEHGDDHGSSIRGDRVRNRGSGKRAKTRGDHRAAHQPTHEDIPNRESMLGMQPGRRMQAIMAERPALQGLRELHTRASPKLPANPSTTWPEETELMRFSPTTSFVKFMREQAILVDITRQLEQESGDSTFKLIRHRIKKDAEYTRDIITIADERVHQKRAEWKKTAKNYIRSEYGLQNGDKDRFNRLADEMEYLFPVINGNIEWFKPFSRPIFTQVLHEDFFKGVGAFASKYASKFPTFNGQRQIPFGMLCCTTVSIYMAMHDIAHNEDKLSIQIKAASWDAEYADVWNFVKGIEAGNPRRFAELLVKLYNGASQGHHVHSRSDRVGNVLAKIDFDKLGGDDTL
ncbi:hypothetical protein K474DRAFT_1679934 [Panus rudis PR-1116 ss-1]|nr:hypothetical protein K474DRAFT_1679934 [Panus rudis PR-1116 ss-1]